MEDRLSIIGSGRCIRDRLFVNKKPTQIEIARINSIFTQIEEALATIENLRRKARASGYKFDVKWQIYEEREHLLAVYELLKEILIDNKVLQEQFVFDIRRTERKVEKILGNLQYFSGRFWKSARIDF